MHPSHVVTSVHTAQAGGGQGADMLRGEAENMGLAPCQQGGWGPHPA